MKIYQLTGLYGLIIASVLFAGCKTTTPPPVSGGNISVILTSEIEWSHLNPKRGDLAPSAGTIWGDRNGDEPTGFLLRPPKNFESPPHIHNISYRGVVIEGVIHNDDPDAEEQWMPAGSFWTQPKGDVHITSAKGTQSLAYIEIEQGPYLVQPSAGAFDSGERSLNMDHANIVWLPTSEIKWMGHSDAETAFLWGSTQPGELNGTFIKLPAGFSGRISSQGSTFRAVLIEGNLRHASRQEVVLNLGSGFASEGKAVHALATEDETLLYVRTDGTYLISSN